MKRWILVVLFVALGAGVVLIATILSVGTNEPAEPLDIAVVMGTKVEADGNPSEKLMLRLDKATELFQTGQVSTLWMTGGKSTSGKNEAVVMKSYLMKQGVPAEAIRVDSLGISTFASARNLSGRFPANASVGIISHTVHLRRCRYAFEQFDQPIQEVIGVSGGMSMLGTELYGVLRECLALPFYWVRAYE